MQGMSLETNESLIFYKYLCEKIGSEEVVRIRRLAMTISDIGQKGQTITSGSKGEGLDLKGSDLDIMYIDPNFKVYQSETEEILQGHKIPLILNTNVKCQIFPIPLIMNTEETQPCFTQLCLLNLFYLRTVCIADVSVLDIRNIMQKHHRGYVLSSELYKQFIFSLPHFHKMMSTIIHGPCLSNKEGTYDFARCLKCDNWILEAQPWVSRPRSAWPSPELISKIISFGVLFVPIGYKGSINENIEWRISFSVAEKNLISSFSHTQLLCYAMLKILLKEIVEKQVELKGLLCSYFLKTLMFWISEETETYLWRPDNIIPCFMACLQRLLYCVRYSILPHYFIPANNFFFVRFNTNKKEKLTTLLKDLYEQGIYCFASSETLQDCQSQLSEKTESLISRNIRFFRQLMPTFYIIHNNAQVDNFTRLLYAFLRHSRTGLSRDLFALQLSAAFTFAPAEPTYQNTCSSGNKQHYCKYKHDLSHLVIGLHSDAVSGLLKLASFFYVHKKYSDSLTIITYVLQKYTNEKIYTGLFDHIKTFNHFQKRMLNLMKKEKLHTIIKSLTVHPFRIEMHSSIVPFELQLDVCRMPTILHPLSFAHFLNFLCYYRLSDLALCKQCLQQLNHVQRTLSYNDTLCLYPDSLHTIIFCGIAHQLMGETHFAIHAFKKAAKLDKFNSTSAATRFAVLQKKIFEMFFRNLKFLFFILATISNVCSEFYP